MQQKQTEISQQMTQDLCCLTTATSTKCLLPDPDFKDLCLKAVVAACFSRNECEMCCHVSVTSCLPEVTQRGFQVVFQGVFVAKLFTLSPRLSHDTRHVCEFTSLFFQGWLKIFQYFKRLFFSEWVSKAARKVRPQR